MGQLSMHELAAVAAVARHVSAKWQTANEDWSDAYLTIDGKQIAVAATTLELPITRRSGLGKPRLRFDKVALRFVRGLQTALGGFVPDGQAVILTITAPIRLPAKTAAALEEKCRAALARRSAQAKLTDTIHGNQIQVRIVEGVASPVSKVIGFVHNPDSDPDVLFELTQSLLRCVDGAAQKGAPNRSTGDRWLVVATENVAPWLSETSRHVFAQLAISTDFNKVLTVRADGSVDSLTE